ncbi:hypothetical protein N7475_007840 [Penicillium sp. IBT 31633x]|nr:hypothetical protein N7475_007840 [Penicillium sp. IBT 31633x]
MSESTPRKRSRLACTLCQSRKRKCSGGQPCSTCAQTGAECQYFARKKRRSHSLYRAGLDERPADGWPNAVPNPISATGNDAAQASPREVENSERVTYSLQANSGAAFVRKLGLRIDPARAPRLQLFAWNIGERRISPTVSSALPSVPVMVPTPTTITKIISQEEMRRLAAIYFEKVDPCYNFLDRKTVFLRIANRWESLPFPIDSTEYPYDAVLCGIAAFGYLFSRREIVSPELQLVETARTILDKSILAAETPSVDIVTGWVLRAAYLRMTASPHAAWMASCTLMHLIEAAGLHLETSDPEAAALLPASPPETRGSQDGAGINTQVTSDPEIRRRLFGMARHLNTWISFDLGRSRVVLHGATALAPSSTFPSRKPPIQAPPRAPRADLFHLLPLSESLDPAGSSPQDLPELEIALTSVLDLLYSEPSLILVQCNLMLCIYRRLRALNPHGPLSSNLVDRVLALAGRGLRAARGMVASCCPWHQVANVPFQVVCSLLAIDNQPALALLADAMRTLREIYAAYDTPSMREAYSTAYLLIALHQRRKEDDTRALAEVLRVNAAAAAPAPAPDMDDNLIARSPLDDKNQILRQQQTAPAVQVSDAEFSWLGDLMIDMPSLQNFDLDQFLMTDVPWPLPEMGI